MRAQVLFGRLYPFLAATSEMTESCATKIRVRKKARHKRWSVNAAWFAEKSGFSLERTCPG